MGDRLKTTLIDVEELQQLSYERSKKWAIFLNSICENEQEEPISIDQLDQVYEEDQEDPSELASMEDEESESERLDSEVLKDITNYSHNRALSKLSESTILHEDTHELVDLFNQTMPVINEHNRQLKDFGLERILNTFDAKKIEEKVGGWLKMHNSLCISNQNEITSIAGCQTIARKPMAIKQYSKHYEDESDSDGSFHSGETARYIRRVGAIKNSSSPTTMIKTYRTIERSRQALRDKYACSQDYEAEMHLKRLRQHRQLTSQMHLIRAHKLKHLYKTPQSQSKRPVRRRKILRKRSFSNSCSAKDTSSDSDSSYCNGSNNRYYCRKRNCCGQYYNGCTPLKSVKRLQHTYAGAIPLNMASSARRSQFRHGGKETCRRSRHLYYNESDSSSVPSSSPSKTVPYSSAYIHERQRRRHMFAEKRHYSEQKAMKNDHKYSTGRGKTLCHEYNHLTNVSTNEWMVEETYISKKLHIETHSEQAQSSITSTNGNTLSIDTETANEAPTSSHKDTTCNASQVSFNKKNEQMPDVKKLSKSETNEESNKLSDDSFEEELQRAIEESKKLYQKEQLKAKKAKSKKERNSLPSKPLVKKLTNKNSLKRDLTEDANMANDDARLSSGKVILKSESDNRVTSMEASTILNSMSTKRNTTIEGSEETFFAVTTRVCNSTALPNDKSACNREIEGVVKINSISSSNKLIQKEKEKPIRPGIKKFLRKNSNKDSNNLNEETPLSEKTKDDYLFARPLGRPRLAVKKSKTMLKKVNLEDNIVNDKHKSLIVKGKKANNSFETIKPLEDVNSNVTKNSSILKKDTKEEEYKDILAKEKEEYSSDLNSKQDENPNSKDDSIILHKQQRLGHVDKETPLKNIHANKTANSNITSTTKSSADMTKTASRLKSKAKKRLKLNSSGSSNDCTIVSSTTNIELQQETMTPVLQPKEASRRQNCSGLQHSRKGILIYTPHNPSPNISLTQDGCFVHISKEHLSSVIGEKPAEKFFKYYIGRRRFHKNSRVYFKPPLARVLDTNETSSSDSDVDDLDRIGKYGALYESIGGDENIAANVDAADLRDNELSQS